MNQNNRTKTMLAHKKWFGSDEFNEKYDYAGRDLGAGYTKEKTVFKVWAPTAMAVSVRLYRYGSAAEAGKSGDCMGTYAMQQKDRGVWQTEISGDCEGVYYTYLVNVDDCVRETGDPYAKACGVNGGRSMVVDLGQTDPDGWQTDKCPENVKENPVIYELHIRDFSWDSHSGVPEQYRGKYKAFTLENTTVDGAGTYPSCMAYLKALGITHVHLLPAFDYASVDEADSEKDQFNWGYDPLNYNVPEGSYATDAFDGHVRIREFKEMVMALHRAGMGVIMDVVYNHTYARDSVFDRTVPGYYYRIYGDGTWANGSACGNDTASERQMFGRYMADSVCYWAEEYHIDGFRFDLMGLHDTETMNEIRTRLDALKDGRDILMYGEPWAAQGTAWEGDAKASVPSNVHLLDPRIAIFCDRTRDVLKGSIFETAERGYVSGSAGEVMALKDEIRSAVCGWCGQGRNPAYMAPLAPSQIITYTSAHDDRTLWDKLVISVEKRPDYRKKYRRLIQMNKMAAGIIFTSLGTPFFLAGEEFARTKLGCANSYDCSSALNCLDWRRAAAYRALTGYYRFLIRLRRMLPVLGRKDAAAADHIRFFERADAVTGFVLEEQTGRCDAVKAAVIYYNPYDTVKMAALPEGVWRLLSDGHSRHSLRGFADVSGSVTLKSRSVTVLVKKLL